MTAIGQSCVLSALCNWDLQSSLYLPEPQIREVSISDPGKNHSKLLSLHLKCVGQYRLYRLPTPNPQHYYPHLFNKCSLNACSGPSVMRGTESSAKTHLSPSHQTSALFTSGMIAEAVPDGSETGGHHVIQIHLLSTLDERVARTQIAKRIRIHSETQGVKISEFG